MNKKTKIELCTLIILSGFFTAVLFHYAAGLYFNKPYPLNTFLFAFQQQFADYYSVYISAHGFNPYTPKMSPVGSVYFPWTYILMYPFCMFSAKTGMILFMFFCTTGFLGFVTYYFGEKSRTMADNLLNIKNIYILSFLTYPFLFSFERGNVEFLVFLIMASFLFFYSRKKYTCSAVFLASAISMKLFPSVFIILFLSDKRYREAALCVCIAALMTTFSLLWLHGNFFEEIYILLKNLQWFQESYIRSPLSMSYNDSFYSLLNIIARGYSHSPDSFFKPVSLILIKSYTIAGIVFFMSVSSWLLLVKMEHWKKITVLTFCMILLPHISFDYKLIHIYLPLFFFINHEEKIKSSSEVIYAVFFALLLIPKNYYLLKINGYAINISGSLNCIILSSMLIYMARETYLSNIQPKIHH